MIRRALAAAASGLLALSAATLPAAAAPEIRGALYICERGVAIAVTYVNAAEGSVAVLEVEGRQIALQQVEAASGARYSWTSDGSHYDWWSKGDGGTLSWFDGTTGETSVLYRDCAAE